MPDDVDVQLAFDQSGYVSNAINGLVREALLGAMLTGVVVLLFLRDWRSALIVVANISFALAGAVVLLWLTGQTCCLEEHHGTTEQLDHSCTRQVRVESHSASRTVPLTAELAPFLQTDIEARVPGYVEKVLVDRGSVVRRGQLLVQLSAPEMRSQTNASGAAIHHAEADQAQAEAQAAAAASTYARLQEAAKTPGAVAGNELVQAEKQKAAADSLVLSRKAAVRSAKDRMQATGDMESNLRVVAPFDGTITEVDIHRS